ncbi:MAG: hypothetical protein H0W64_01405 [Gammaproteobacteria bacterium]|nr:hypothetical protein [Gammaproteobacteria bacterium]
MPNKNIIIVGAGLSGLTAIIKFLQNASTNPSLQFEINVIEKRSLNFNRRQKLINLNKREFQNFHDFPTSASNYWDGYCKQLFDPNDQYSLNHEKQLVHKVYGIMPEAILSKREKFLRKLFRQDYSYLHPFTNKKTFKNFSIKELQFALLEHINELQNSVPNVEINWHVESQIRNIDFETKELTVVAGDRTYLLKFDAIFNCEGTKAETTDIINTSLPPNVKEKFAFEKIDFPLLYHCAVRLKLKPNVIPQEPKSLIKFFSQQKNKNHHLAKKFKKIGFVSPTPPNLFIIDDNAYKYEFEKEKLSLRIFVASEIPKKIYDIPDLAERKKIIIQWAKLIASIRYGISDEFFEFDDRGETDHYQINALTFANELKAVNRPEITLPNGVVIFLVGDANLSNFYPMGCSALFGLNEAIEAVELICKENQSKDSYVRLFNFYRLHLVNELEAMDSLLHRDFKAEIEEQKLANLNMNP